MSFTSFGDFISESQALQEAFNTAPYEITFGKKNAGDIFFTFVDEDEKEFRIQFYTPAGLGKAVRQVFIGQKRGSTYPDVISKFKNPMRVIATMIEATKQYLQTPIGKGIDGFAINFSKKALERGLTLLPKIIRQSGLKQKLNVMDLTYSPDPSRGYVWVIRKGKDPAKVFDGPKMQGITWDDPDKVGDVPDQAYRDAELQGDIDDLSQHISRHMKKTPSTFDQDAEIRAEKITKIYDAIRKINRNITCEAPGETSFTLKSSLGVVYGTARVNTDPNDEWVGAVYQVAGKKPGDILYRELKPVNYRDFETAAMGIASQMAKLYNQFIPEDWNVSVMAKSAGIFSTAIQVKGNDITLKSKDVAIMVRDGAMANIAKGQTACQVTVFNKQFVGRGEITKARMAADRQGLGWELKHMGKVVAFVEFGVGATAQTVNTEVLPAEASAETLREQGFIARLLGIIDTYAPQQVGMYNGEKLTRVQAGKYRTAGGLDIQVYFWGASKGKLDVSVTSELSGEDNFQVSGKTKDAAMEIVKHISAAADAQFNGQIDVRVIPAPGAAYAIRNVSRSQGYCYVDCDSFTLKVADALWSRVKVGKALELDMLSGSFPQGSFKIRYHWRNVNNLMMQSPDGKTIYGDIDTNVASAKGGAETILASNLKMPENGIMLDDNINGLTVGWNVRFPVGGNLDGAKLVTNVTFDRGNGKANINTMLIKGGRTLKYKSYDIPLKMESIQTVLYEMGARFKEANNQISHLNSDGYNPNKLFLDDVDFDKQGEITFQGQVLHRSENRNLVVTTLARANEKADSGQTLKSFADQVEKSAPKGRDIDWQITNGANGLSINWSITFRRNTSQGAFRDYSVQVNVANAYVKVVADNAKKQGFRVVEMDILTADKARADDERREDYGESAYSEYEQSIGGGITIK